MNQLLYFVANTIKSIKTPFPFRIGNSQLNKHNENLSSFKFFKTKFSDNGPHFIYSSRFLCTSQHLRLPVNEVTYKELKIISKEKRKDNFIIDVRQPEELQETGEIPGSINVPLDQLEGALKGLSSEEFEKKYGLQKPKKESLIIFSCLLGKRSREAQTIAQKLGYKNSKNYIGGWKDWEEHLKQ